MSEDPNPQSGSFYPLTGSNTIQLVYILQTIGFFLAFTWIAGVIINYLKRDEVRGSWLESHCRWQMRTFWFGLLWGVIGLITALVGVGFVILIVNYIWLIYRVIKGWLNLSGRKPMYDAQPGSM